MVLVEMSFCAAGGLEELVERLAGATEARLEAQNLGWRDEYPITLRESLRLGLQQQIVGGYGKRGQNRPEEPGTYRVWIALPDGGLRAWTHDLGQRILDGCGQSRLPMGAGLRRQIQSSLVEILGPCLQRAEASSLLPGVAAV